MRSLLVLLFAVCALAQILPTPCSTMGFECVGEGASCTSDVGSGGSSNCDPSSQSLCRICGDATLVCYNGQCIKRTQGPGQSCVASNREFCLYELTCSGTCIDPVNSAASNFAGFDEPCDTVGDCLSFGLLFCDPFLKTCRLTPPEPYTCSQEYDCPSGYTCALADTTVSPSVPRQCKKAISLGSRDGALCSRPESATEQNNLECGYLYSCQQLNPFESDARFIRRVCVAPFSLGPGRLCANNYFCASGICNFGYCADYDPGTYGLGCQNNGDCGRFLNCDCPIEGGGRSRCVPNSPIRTNDRNRQEYARQKGYLSCLEAHGCQYLHAFLGTCGWNNCRSHLTGLSLQNYGSYLLSDSGIYGIQVSRALETPLPKCEVLTSGYPAYGGYEVVVSAATGSFRLSFIPLLLAFFALCGLW